MSVTTYPDRGGLGINNGPGSPSNPFPTPELAYAAYPLGAEYSVEVRVGTPLSNYGLRYVGAYPMVGEAAANWDASDAQSVSVNLGQSCRVVVIGDSQAAGDTSFSNNPYQVYNKSAWPTHMALASGGRMILLRNVAVGGQRTDQMLSRFDTDVLALDPDTVLISASINDGNLAGGYKDGIKNTIAMIRKARTYRSPRCPNGCRVILVTTPPTGTYALNNASEQSKQTVSGYNIWKEEYCRRNKIPLIDIHSFLGDAQGSYKNGATEDGVHFILDPWNKDVGEFAWQQISSFFQPATALPKSNTDPFNLFPNGMFYPAGSGTPSGWGAYGSGTVVTTREAVAGFRGNVLKVVNTGAGTQYYDSAAVSLTAIRGHKLRLSFQLQSASAAFKWSGGVYNNQAAMSCSPTQITTNPGECISEVTVPPDATGIYCQLSALTGRTSYLASVGIYDLTAMEVLL